MCLHRTINECCDGGQENPFSATLFFHWCTHCLLRAQSRHSLACLEEPTEWASPMSGLSTVRTIIRQPRRQSGPTRSYVLRLVRPLLSANRLVRFRTPASFSLSNTSLRHTQNLNRVFPPLKHQRAENTVSRAAEMAHDSAARERRRYARYSSLPVKVCLYAHRIAP